MNAGEARYQALWNQLDSYIRERIEEEVNDGFTSFSINYEISDKNKDILTNLGYLVTFDGKTSRIKW